MHVTINGRPIDLPEDASVSDLLETLGHGDRRVAVEVNQEIVPRSLHGAHRLAEGDQVELVHAMGGG